MRYKLMIYGGYTPTIIDTELNTYSFPYGDERNVRWYRMSGNMRNIIESNSIIQGESDDIDELVNQYIIISLLED